MAKSKYKEALIDMVHQFAYPCVPEGSKVPCLITGGLSALEFAFEVLGWSEPYPVPELKCEIVGCPKMATCGTPVKSDYAKIYMRLCGEHFTQVEKEEAEEKAGRPKRIRSPK